MRPLIPNSFLFKMEYPVYHCPRPPKINGDLSKWSDQTHLPPLHALDEGPSFAGVFVTWDENGIYVGCKVDGKRSPLRCNPEKFWKSDNIRVMSDMRDTRNIHRASRFCQQFYLLPAGGGKDGSQATAGGATIHRAKEHAPVAAPGDIPIASKITQHGYTLTAHLPATVLSGFDPVENPRIGLFIIVEDLDLGQQSLTVGDDLNWHIDPSTWPTAVLTP